MEKLYRLIEIEIQGLPEPKFLLKKTLSKTTREAKSVEV